MTAEAVWTEAEQQCLPRPLLRPRDVSVPFRTGFLDAFRDAHDMARFITPAERVWLAHRRVERILRNTAVHVPGTNDESLWDVVEDVLAVHDSAIQSRLRRQWLLGAHTLFGAPIGALQAYFGDQVALYFAFLKHYASWIGPPALFGIVVFLLQLIDADWAWRNHLPPPASARAGSFFRSSIVARSLASVPSVVFSVFVIGWGSLCLKQWVRSIQDWSAAWGRVGLESSSVRTRRDFAPASFWAPAVKVEDPWEARVVWREHSAVRMLRRVVAGCSVTLMGGCLAVGLMLSAERLRSYVEEELDEEWTRTEYGYVRRPPMLGDNYDKDNWDEFHWDAAGDWLRIPLLLLDYLPHTLSTMQVQMIRQVPTVIYAACLPVVDIINAHLAEWITWFENHRTHAGHQSALVARQAFFQTLNQFVAPLYAGFVRQDLGLLHDTLWTIFVVRQVILQNVTELLVPFVQSCLRRRRQLHQQALDVSSMMDAPTSETDARSNVGAMRKAWSLPPYAGVFDDICEVYLQFAQIMFFGTVFPLGPLIAMFSTRLEARVDALKLLSFRRPLPELGAGWAAWKRAFHAVLIAGVFVQVGLLAVAFSQLPAQGDRTTRASTEATSWVAWLLFRGRIPWAGGSVRSPWTVPLPRGTVSGWLWVLAVEHGMLLLLALVGWGIANESYRVVLLRAKQRAAQVRLGSRRPMQDEEKQEEGDEEQDDESRSAARSVHRTNSSAGGDPTVRALENGSALDTSAENVVLHRAKMLWSTVRDSVLHRAEALFPLPSASPSASQRPMSSSRRNETAGLVGAEQDSETSSDSDDAGRGRGGDSTTRTPPPPRRHGVLGPRSLASWSRGPGSRVSDLRRTSMGWGSPESSSPHGLAHAFLRRSGGGFSDTATAVSGTSGLASQSSSTIRRRKRNPRWSLAESHAEDLLEAIAEVQAAETTAHRERLLQYVAERFGPKVVLDLSAAKKRS